jgi:hypothetical protein
MTVGVSGGEGAQTVLSHTFQIHICISIIPPFPQGRELFGHYFILLTSMHSSIAMELPPFWIRFCFLAHSLDLSSSASLTLLCFVVFHLPLLRSPSVRTCIMIFSFQYCFRFDSFLVPSDVFEPPSFLIGSTLGVPPWLCIESLLVPSGSSISQIVFHSTNWVPVSCIIRTHKFMTDYGGPPLSWLSICCLLGRFWFSKIK